MISYVTIANNTPHIPMIIYGATIQYLPVSGMPARRRQIEMESVQFILELDNSATYWRLITGMRQPKISLMIGRE